MVDESLRLMVGDSVFSHVGAELAAMQAVGNALAMLPDHEARLRVIRWASERFQAAARAQGMAVPPDPTLALDGIQDLLSKLSTHVKGEIDNEEPESLVQGFDGNYKRFAIEWQRA